MIVPQGEGVVVAIGKDDGAAFLGQALQIVLSVVPTGVASGTVMVVPRLAYHLKGDKHTKHRRQHHAQAALHAQTV